MSLAKRDRGLLRRRVILFAIAVVAAIGSGIVWKWHVPARSSAPPPEQVKWVSINPDIKPIATPPPLTTPPDQKVDEPKQVLPAEPEVAAANPQPAAAVDEPPEAMGSNIKGKDGSLVGDGLGKVGSGGHGKGSGNPYGSLAPQIQGRIATALRQDRRTRGGSYHQKVKLWLDAGGSVVRAESSASEQSEALAVLRGLKILDRTPTGMPMPILTSIDSVRPR